MATQTMTMQVELPKTGFENRLEVMRVRQNFVGPYRKYRFLYVQRPDLKDRKTFVKKIEESTNPIPEDEAKVESVQKEAEEKIEV